VGKTPKKEFFPTSTKQPKAEPRSYYGLNPSWRIRRMEFVDPFGWHTLNAASLGYVRSGLVNFESMTWNEILVQGRKQNHLIAIGELSKAARDRLNVLFNGNIDVDELLSLRLTGKERVWGILDNGVLVLLWWDPQHQVCPSALRNT